MPLFVYLEGLKGPSPQIWHHEQVTGEGKDKKKPLQVHKISKAEAELGTSYLMDAYPYEQQS